MNSTKEILNHIEKRIRQFRKHGYDVRASRRRVLELLGKVDGPVLDVGTGKGHLALEAARSGLKLTSIDTDTKQLVIARSFLKSKIPDSKVSFRKTNAENLPFDDGHFEAVISIDFFHHAKKTLACLKEMIRVTRRRLVIADLNPKGLRMMDRFHRQQKGHHHPVAGAGIDDVAKWARKKKFFVKKHRDVFHTYLVIDKRQTK